MDTSRRERCRCGLIVIEPGTTAVRLGDVLHERPSRENGYCGPWASHELRDAREEIDRLREERNRETSRAEADRDRLAAEVERQNRALDEHWRSEQQGHTDPCTYGSLCPWCEVERLTALKVEAEALYEEAATARDSLRAELDDANRTLLRWHIAANREGWEDGESEAEAREAVMDYLANHNLDPYQPADEPHVKAMLATPKAGATEGSNDDKG